MEIKSLENENTIACVEGLDFSDNVPNAGNILIRAIDGAHSRYQFDNLNVEKIKE